MTRDPTRSTDVQPGNEQPAENEIHQLAYWLYEYEDRPQRREMDHWLMAENVLLTERRMNWHCVTDSDVLSDLDQPRHEVIHLAKEPQHSGIRKKQLCQ